MPIVKMPDGTQVRFPDDMPREEIQRMILSKFPDAGQAAQSSGDWARRPEGNVNEFRGNPMELAGEVGNMWGQHIQQTPERAATFTENAIESVPIAGPLAMQGMDAAGANIRSMITGQPAEQEMAGIRAGALQRSQDHAEAAMGGQIAGAVGPLAGLGMTKVGGQALGMSGPLWQRMIAGGLSGGAIAGGDTAARGGDAGEVVSMTGLGLGAGVGFPLLERAASPLVRAITGTKGPTREAAIANRSLQRDQIDPAQLPQMLDDMGPYAMPMDLGENTMRTGSAIAAAPGEGQTVVRDALTARQWGDEAAGIPSANMRVQTGVNEALGPAPVPSQVNAQLNANRQALSPEYTSVLEGSGVTAVDTSDLALTLDSLAVARRGDAQRAATRVREMLNIPGTSELDRSPSTLLATRNAIDGMMDGAIDNNVKAVLTEARREVDSLLTRSVPGIKDVDARFQDIAEQGAAFGEGQRILRTGPEAPHPFDVAQRASQVDPLSELMVGPSGVPFRLSQGARADIDRLIGTKANDILALRQAVGGEGDWNRAKLVSAFGADKADQLLAILSREQRMNRTFNAVTQNSETAARAAGMQDITPAQFGETPQTLWGTIMRLPQGAANLAARTRSESVNRRIADLLTNRPTQETVEQLLAARNAANRRGIMAPASLPLLLTNSGGGGGW